MATFWGRRKPTLDKRIFKSAFLFALAILSYPHSAAARNCTALERKAADRQLWLNERDHNLSMRMHLPWGAPSIGVLDNEERMLAQRDYVIRYDAALLNPLFTAERVDAARLKAKGRKKVVRTDCFRRDVRINATEASKPSDFDEAIFDQGHLAAFANQNTSVVAGNNSFIMSNMTPQTCQFNRGIWQILEGVVRLWAAQRKTIYVISGSVFDRDRDGKRDSDTMAARMQARNGTARVAIPTDFYKILAYKRSDGVIETLSFLMPHNQLNPSEDAAVSYLVDHITKVSEIEQQTGFDFFADVTEIQESETFWDFERRKLPKSLCRAPANQDFELIWKRGALP